MKAYPSIPRVENAPDRLFDSGHLWLLEKVDGANFRFQLQESGLIRFGDRSRVYDDPDDVPEPYQHAVRHVQENLERDALRSAVDDVEDVVFFGEAMHRHTIEYDWERTPSFLGFDVWSAEVGAFRPPDAVEGIFEGIGLEAVNAVERELHTRDFDPDSYTIPDSAWYNGPAKGVVIRNKQGDRAKLLHPDFQDVDETTPVDASAEELAATYATRRRFETVAATLEDRGQPVTFETLYERVLEDIVREEHKQLYDGEGSLEMGTFRSEVSALTREFLEEWRDGE
ncbi:RNA ligase family protein [Natrialbaceae archaeon AArc-T1-2]|uniref:RNA ligase family protein n=1 Tax=Natrialbaceae archaeon AArc-T1-2 TaxID=3053904 RepID=UPI00255AB834|nr:RNA ligase family protein [Natrialbaceae archaeon AArc-T1-2]WIV66381.1 RNA ligase family protein [Natrialbaceae archaeon AArc-T1-2]